MRYLRTNTATIVTVGPFFDKTDGVTIETALTITNEKISFTVDLNEGSAPTLVLDNVTGATSGTSNDLNYITNCDAGLMQLELAADNVNYLGRAFLTITDAANHVPVFHEFTILPALVYDSLILGTDALQVDTIQVGGTSQTARDIGASVLLSAGTGTGQVSMTSGIVNAKLADGAHGGASASLALGAGATISNASGSALAITSSGGNGHGLIVQGNGTGSGLTAVGGGTSGNGIYAAGDADGHGIYAAGGDSALGLTAGLFVKSNASSSPVGLYVEDGAIITDDAGTALLISSTGGDGDGVTLVGNGSGGDLVADIIGNLSGSVGSVTGAVGSVTGNVGGNVTGSVGSMAAGGITAESIATNAIDADALAADAANEIADAILARNVSGGSSAGRTVKQALHAIRNKVAISGGTMTVYDVNDTDASWTAAVTGAEGANPITTVDPA